MKQNTSLDVNEETKNIYVEKKKPEVRSAAHHTAKNLKAAVALKEKENAFEASLKRLKALKYLADSGVAGVLEFAYICYNCARRRKPE